MKIAFILIGALSLAAGSVTIQKGIDEVNKYLSGQTSDLSGILYFLRHNALINHNDYNVFIKPLNNPQNAKNVAKAVLKHLQIDQAIQDIKPYQTANAGNVNELVNLLNKDLFKQVLLNNNDQQALINALNNQVAPQSVVRVILKHLQIEQAIQLLKYYQIGESGNDNTLTNILNNDLVNEGLISHQDYNNFKGQLIGGERPNRVANAVVGFLHQLNNVQVILHNLRIDQAIQALKNFQLGGNGNVNALTNILNNDLLNKGLISNNDNNVFIGSLKNRVAPGDVANAVLKHLQIDLAIQYIKNAPSGNSGDALFYALNNLLNKDLFKKALLNHHDHQASINSLNNQVAPGVVADAIIKHLQSEQAIQLLKYFELGNSENSYTLTNILNEDLVSPGLIISQDYDNFKKQLTDGQTPNRVALAVVGFLYNRKNVQILINNVPYDRAIQVLENYRAENSGDVNALFNILHNDFLTRKGLITNQEYGTLKSQFGAAPINNNPNELANRAIELLNGKKQVQSD